MQNERRTANLQHGFVEKIFQNRKTDEKHRIHRNNSNRRCGHFLPNETEKEEDQDDARRTAAAWAASAGPDRGSYAKQFGEWNVQNDFRFRSRKRFCGRRSAIHFWCSNQVDKIEKQTPSSSHRRNQPQAEVEKVDRRLREPYAIESHAPSVCNGTRFFGKYSNLFFIFVYSVSSIYSTNSIYRHTQSTNWASSLRSRLCTANGKLPGYGWVITSLCRRFYMKSWNT